MRDPLGKAAVLDQIGESVIATDLSGRIVYWNRGATRTFGYTAEEMRGLTPAVLSPACSPEALRDHLARLREGHDYVGECAGRAKDGRELIVAIRASLMRDDHGEPVGFVGTAFDITASRRQIEEKLQWETRYRLVMRASNEAIWDWDLVSGRLAWNEGISTCFGWPMASLGPDVEWWNERLHPSDLERVGAGLEAAIRGQASTWQDEYRFLRADGSWAEVHDRGYIQRASGRPLRMVGSMRDVTEEQRRSRIDGFLSDASAMLGSSIDYERTLAALVERAVTRIADWCAVDIRGTSGALERIAIAYADPEDAPIAEILRRYPIVDRSHDPERKRFVEGEPLLVAEVGGPIATHARTEEEARALRAAQVRSWMAVPIVVGGGLRGALAFAHSRSGRRFDERDLDWARELGRRCSSVVALSVAVRERDELVRRLRERESEVRAAMERAEEANRAKDAFLAMLGHELRNPLAPIRTALQLMEMRDPNAFSREREILDRQVGHMVRLVDDLLDVSRIIRGSVELRRARVDLAEVVADAIETASALIERRGHRLEAHVQAGLVLDADRDRLKQVFVNLLTNAAKYTEPGGRVAIEADREDGNALVRVSDSGRGIAPELLPRIFEPFAQGWRAIDRREGGLGLGLTIVKSFVELHGGTVSVSSPGVGEGSTFEVRLPLHASAEVSESGPRPDGPTQHGRVLVVDDNEDAAELLAESLHRLGWVTRVANDGPSALEVAAEFHPDVAVLDIGLPVMDGYELARRMRAEHSTPHLVAVTGYGQPSDRERAREAGFDEHFVKPVSIAALHGALREWTAEAVP